MVRCASVLPDLIGSPARAEIRDVIACQRSVARVGGHEASKEGVYFSHFVSGAVIRNIVGRAKLLALLRTLGQGQPGLRRDDLRAAAVQEMQSVDDLTNITSPDDWSRISDARGERITCVRTLRGL
jgi:hypothetical protein